MGRGLPSGSEIVGCRDNAVTEVPGPDAVDHDACGQGMVWPCEPEGEFFAAAEGLGHAHVAAGRGRECFGQCGVDSLADARELATLESMYRFDELGALVAEHCRCRHAHERIIGNVGIFESGRCRQVDNELADLLKELFPMFLFFLIQLALPHLSVEGAYRVDRFVSECDF